MRTGGHVTARVYGSSRDEDSSLAWRQIAQFKLVKMCGLVLVGHSRMTVLRRDIKNVSISEQMWYYLGAEQAKVTGRYWYRRWGSREAAVPQYDAKRLQALRLAAWLFDLGRDKEWRREFARRLSQERAMIYPWFRRLVLELEGVRPPGSLTADVSLRDSGSSERGRVFVFFPLLLIGAKQEWWPSQTMEATLAGPQVLF